MNDRDSPGRPGNTTQYLADRIRAARRTAGMSQSRTSLRIRFWGPHRFCNCTTLESRARLATIVIR